MTDSDSESSSDATLAKPPRRNRAIEAAAIDLIPPHSPMAEQGVLGCIMLSPNGCITDTEKVLGRDGAAFYDLRNQTIFTQIVALHDHSIPVDAITLHNALRDRQLLDQVGGLQYILTLDDDVPTPAHLPYYLNIVSEKHVLRRLMQACTAAVGRIYDFEGDVPDLVGEVQRNLASLLSPLSRSQTDQDWSFKDLMAYDVANDPNAVIGWRDGKATRYLCRGYAAWLIGQSGIGKSSLGQQQCIFWTLGRPFCGITPVRPLRVLVVQSENDIGDSAESTQGIIDSIPDLTPADHARLNDCFKVKRCVGRTGKDFCQWLEREIIAWRAELVYVDPLLRYAGIDVSRQDQCTKFLNDCLDPVLARTGVVMIGAHHTGKPKSKQDTKGQTIYDRAYAGIGSSELVNWARAVTIVEARADGLFEMLLAKRGGRAWATHPAIDEPTTAIYLKHSPERIFWIQTDPPAELERRSRGDGKTGRPNKTEKIASMNLFEFCNQCKPEGEGLREICRRLEAWLAKEKVDASGGTIRRAVKDLVANGKLAKNADGQYLKGAQA